MCDPVVFTAESVLFQQHNNTGQETRTKHLMECFVAIVLAKIELQYKRKGLITNKLGHRRTQQSYIFVCNSVYLNYLRISISPSFCSYILHVTNILDMKVYHAKLKDK